MQASYQYGLNNLLTLYGGTMLGTDYQALLWEPGGIPISARCPLTVPARSDQDNGTFEGQSYQIAYNKYLTQTKTRFGMAAYRYSTSDYRTFNDHVWAKNRNSYHHDDNDVYNIDDYYRYDFGRKIAYPPILASRCRKD